MKKNLLPVMLALIALVIFMVRPASAQSSILRINLYAKNQWTNNWYLADGTLAEYNAAYGDGYSLEDALKFGNPNETFGLMRENPPGDSVFLAVERRAAATLKSSDVLWLRIDKMGGNALDYRMEIICTGFTGPGLMFGKVVDTKNPAGSLAFNLTGTTIFTFTVPSYTNTGVNGKGEDSRRFRIDLGNTSFRLAPPFSFAPIAADRSGIRWNVKNQDSIVSYEAQILEGQWYRTIGTIAKKTDTSYNYTTSFPRGRVNVRVKANKQNGSFVYSDTSSIEPITQYKVDVYPNSVRSGAQIRIGFNDLVYAPSVVQITSADGRILLIKQIFGGDQTISLPGFQQGMYFLKVYEKGTGRQIVLERIMILP